jgi:hypothetical protein
LRAADPFWQARYYDFNLWSGHKFVARGSLKPLLLERGSSSLRAKEP